MFRKLLKSQDYLCRHGNIPSAQQVTEGKVRVFDEIASSLSSAVAEQGKADSSMSTATPGRNFCEGFDFLVVQSGNTLNIGVH